ncbi:hypothetical protein JCM12294_14370 [Desulfocicer niacini]
METVPETAVMAPEMAQVTAETDPGTARDMDQVMAPVREIAPTPDN